MIDGIKYMIEVKSSEGEDEFFKLGPTEVKKASAVAGSKKTKYRIDPACYLGPVLGAGILFPAQPL